jgi:glycosyltransferase involved in cell wall biosynthesis
MLPKITVVTPTFQHAHYLEKTIRSVLEQRYPNLEYIIADGGSNDGTVEIIRHYADRLAWWVSQPDSGPQEAIDKGFRRATGEVLAWLAASDTYLPGALLTVGKFFGTHPTIDWIAAPVLIRAPNGRLAGVWRPIPYTLSLAKHARTAVPQPAVFWRRRLYDRTGGFDLNLRVAFDQDLFARMARMGRGAVLRRFIAVDLRHPDSLRARHSERAKAELRLLRERYGMGEPPPLVRAVCRAADFLRVGDVPGLLRDALQGLRLLP